MAMPSKLQRMLAVFATMADRDERIDLLNDLARRYCEVPEVIARRPFDEAHRVPACDSLAYVWSESAGDGTLNLYFAVENPQGVAAQALAGLLMTTASGSPIAEVADLDPDLVDVVFGDELTPTKRLGLANMVGMVRHGAAGALRAPD